MYFIRLTLQTIVTAIITMCLCTSLQAETFTDSVTVYFPLQNADVDADFMCNGDAMEAFSNRLKGYLTEHDGKIESITIQGFASPEGPQSLNKRLCTERANSLRKFASSYILLPGNNITIQGKGIDTESLRNLINEDPFISDREDIRLIIDRINNDNTSEILSTLFSYLDGEPYRYLSSRIFPWMRNARIITTIVRPDDESEQVVTVPEPEPVCELTEDKAPQQTRTEISETKNPEKPFYLAFKTNMLYDAALIPNIGIEFYVGKGASIGANWMYAWWSKNATHRYWRTYGGDIHMRLWLGKKAERKPLTGHHLGIYAQMLTYDIEFGGKGYMGPRWSYGGGLEYGFSLPVAKRLNIDFSIGVGYLDGYYYKYLPIDGHYVWQSTKKRHWIGPTKAEISLIWLIGRGNCNNRKRRAK